MTESCFETQKREICLANGVEFWIFFGELWVAGMTHFSRFFSLPSLFLPRFRVPIGAKRGVWGKKWGLLGVRSEESGFVNF